MRKHQKNTKKQQLKTWEELEREHIYITNMIDLSKHWTDDTINIERQRRDIYRETQREKQYIETKWITKWRNKYIHMSCYYYYI